MSVTGMPQDHPDRLLKKSFHRRNDSGELDVFEAARYFSGYNEASGGCNGSSFTQKMMKEDNIKALRGGRISLDMPIRHVLNPHQHHHHHHQVVNMDHNKQMMMNNLKDKKNKQPSSPGGRLASFLNSLFSQSASRKKKSKPSSAKLDHEQLEESPGGRRKRRSSISHFRSSSAADSKSSIYSSSSSGFRTPPAYAQTPTKISYKDFKAFANKQNNNNNNNNNNTSCTTTITSEDRAVEESVAPKDVQKESKNLGNIAVVSSEKDKINWVAHVDQKYRSDLEIKDLGLFRRFDNDDEHDSDSSSDLFELQNYDLGCYASGLPVYETTNMDSIKRGAPISSA